MKKSVIFFIILFFSVSPAQEFRFAVWGDSQFQNPEVFEETVKRTHLLNPDFVIHVGDMIHGYTYSIDTVSYTHLDVYKRQELTCLIRIL